MEPDDPPPTSRPPESAFIRPFAWEPYRQGPRAHAAALALGVAIVAFMSVAGGIHIGGSADDLEEDEGTRSVLDGADPHMAGAWYPEEDASGGAWGFDPASVGVAAGGGLLVATLAGGLVFFLLGGTEPDGDLP